MNAMGFNRVDNVAQDARHTTGEWLTWALESVEDPRREFESTVREIVSEKIASTHQGAQELLQDTTPPRESDWDCSDQAA
jgi:hypothetical protein